MSNPHMSEAAHWVAAFEHYQWDRMAEAFDLISEQGVGESGSLLKDYRLIEAEALTRLKGTTVRVNDWLTLEYVLSEMMGFESKLPAKVLKACDEIAIRLGWTHSRATLVSILAEETDADWATYPYGYCAAKEPYEKICLPNYLLDDDGEFHRAVSHEYAHVISSNLSNGNAPRWLEEAISILAEGTIDDLIARQFRDGSAPWLGPTELEEVFETRGEAESELEEVLRAYQQSGWIGRYLVSIGTELTLGEMLLEHANDQIGKNLRLRLRGLERIDGALEAVYGLRLRKVFENAYQFLCESVTTDRG